MSNTRTTITNRDEAWDMLAAAQKRRQERALEALVALSPDSWGYLTTRCNCSEIEVLAEFLEAYEVIESAAVLIDEHMADDDEIGVEYHTQRGSIQ